MVTRSWVQARSFGLALFGLQLLSARAVAGPDTGQRVPLSAREYDCTVDRKTLRLGDAKTQSEAMRIARQSSISKAIDMAGFVDLELPLPHNEAGELKPFADASHVIVSGVIGNRRCSVTADDRWIVSAYMFKPDEVFKGSVSDGQELIVLVMGGAVTFEDGTCVQMVSDRFVTPVAGERYLLFLRRSEMALGDALLKRVGSAGAFQMTQMGPGAFKLDPNGIARSSVNTQGRVMAGKNLIQTYNGQPVERLLRDLRSALGK